MNAGAFASAALDLAEAGCAVIPCEGKATQIGWKKWEHRPSAESIKELAGRFGDCNVGILTGKLSKVVVVDVDDAGVAEQMVERFGDTPLVAGTPSGGAHFWYRWNGERCSNLRKPEGLAVDIKGAGGMVVAPPSVNPITGKRYVWVRGSPADIQNLPGVRPGSMPEAAMVAVAAPTGTIKKGLRNDTLFKGLLRAARWCDSVDALQDVAETRNETYDPPMSAERVARAVGSAWDFENNPKRDNWVGGESMIAFTASHTAILEGNPYAMAFRNYLQRMHGARTEPFALVAKAMAEANCIPGLGHNSYRAATTWLVGMGFLRIVHLGGAGRGDPKLYTLSRPKFRRPQ